MARLFANNAKGTLASSINDVATTIYLKTGEGAKFPSPSGADYFDLTLTDSVVETSWEIVKVTARSDDTLTVTRGQYGTTATSWVSDSKAELRVHKAILEAVPALGKAYIGYWPASAMKPSKTTGSAPVAYDESTTNKVMVGYLAFDAAAIEYAQFSFKAPVGLDESAGFTAIFEWMEAASATSHDCVWQIEMQAQGDADTVDSAWGTAVTVTDTGASGTRHITAETGIITAGGTWAAGDEIIVRVSRLATNVSDTLNVDAKLIGVTLFATQLSLTE
jgi:hypothetical protein